MRITDLLHADREISKAQYEKLRRQGLKVVMCSLNGWDFDKYNDTTEAEARKWVHSVRLIRQYERQHGGDSRPLLIIRIVVNSKNEPQPEWPNELQPYQQKTDDNILEAYFCHKFNIPFE